MLSFKEVRQKFQKICVEAKGSIILVFGQLNPLKINSVKIISKDDDLEASLLIAADAECVCLDVVELEKGESALAEILKQNGKRKLEAIIEKVSEACLKLKT